MLVAVPSLRRVCSYDAAVFVVSPLFVFTSPSFNGQEEVADSCEVITITFTI